MSEFNIYQSPVFVPADMFRQPTPELTVVPEVDVTPSEVNSPADAAMDVAGQTLSVEPMAVIDSVAEADVAERTGLARAAHIGKRAVETSVMIFEFSPFNEGGRYAAAALAFAATHNPLATAGTIGATTFAMEAICALAAGDLLSSEVAGRWIEKINAFAEKRGISREAKLNGGLKAAVAYLGGAAVLQAFKKREEPDQTRGESIVYGVKTAAALSGVVATQAYLAANGIAHPEPGTIAGAAVGIGSIFGIYNWAKRRAKRDNTAENLILEAEALND